MSLQENLNAACENMKQNLLSLPQHFYQVTKEYLRLVDVELEEAKEGESAEEYEARLTSQGYNWADGYTVIFPKENDVDQDHTLYCHLIEHITKRIWRLSPRKIALLHISIVPSDSKYTCIAQFNWRAPTAAMSCFLDPKETRALHNFLAVRLKVYPEQLEQ